MNKILKVIAVSAALVIVNATALYAKPRVEYGQPVKTYTSTEGLDIISYSQKWNTQEKLAQVYDELMNNFHSKELNYLDVIYLYPDSPDGANGYYYEAATISNEGKYVYGNDAYIEIFNADDYSDISQMAGVLAHEYGHHFTYFYLITAENKYSDQWYDTGYARIRQLDRYDAINYNNNDTDEYVHAWDITEIAAEDYVQLFGSPAARQSVDYKDVSERLKDNLSEYFYFDNSYNLLPQENLNLPLATEVDGLYNYWLNLAGYTAAQPSLVAKPIPYISDVEEVYFDNNKKYTLRWNEIPDGKKYEYTVVMYPKNMPYFPIPIKTVKTGEEMVAFIGSDVKYESKDDAYGILEQFDGEYDIRIFVKDMNNFLFSSLTLYYDFTNEFSYYDAGVIEYANSQNNNLLKYQPLEFEPLYQPIFSNQRLVAYSDIDQMNPTTGPLNNNMKSIGLDVIANNKNGYFVPAQRRYLKAYGKPIIKLTNPYIYNSLMLNPKRQT